MSRVLWLGGGERAAALVSTNRGASIEDAVGWWMETLRVPPEINHQPAGLLPTRWVGGRNLCLA